MAAIRPAACVDQESKGGRVLVLRRVQCDNIGDGWLGRVRPWNDPGWSSCPWLVFLFVSTISCMQGSFCFDPSPIHSNLQLALTAVGSPVVRQRSFAVGTCTRQHVLRTWTVQWPAGWQVGALWTGSRPRQFGLLPIEEEAGKG
jgi:hypothetical protein